MRFAYGTEELTVTWPYADPVVLSYRTPVAEGADADALLRQALRSPIDSPSLPELAAGRRDAVILVSDVTRLSPTASFLAQLLDALNEGGIPDERVRVVVALGTHRAQTADELRGIAGESAFRRVLVENHSAASEDCLFVGTTSLGTPIELNRKVAEADLRIATGNIEPHRLVGLSGGCKALFPGVASAASIERHHGLSHRYRAVPGFADNPLHRDIEEACAMVPIHFLYNVVADHRRRALAAFAGHPTEAHRRGASFARDQFLVSNERKYDVVVASAGGYPKDMQLYQAIKSLENAAAFAKPGGSILLIARCQELYGNGTFLEWAETRIDRERAVRELEERFVLGAHKLHILHQVLQKHRVFLYSDVPRPLAELLGFRTVSDLQLWIDEAARRGASMAAMPCASLTFPDLSVRDNEMGFQV
ncbi:nickel-dependent lactate racemase [Paenibacillus antri]|uniref:Nickel-dependent lactate racemase n=1 Tax=Paenibacillus antri TaxID=2582848 RepID=A0A5R9FZ73_9BACL|nr:nickel-dependent lactate racemase [Paenibacillus antri]TLS49362.1 nickel-dependent lactate racemase [Paenibacillus antri]